MVKNRALYYYDKYLNQWQCKCKRVTIYDIYSKPSDIKKTIWSKILKEYDLLNGRHLTIITATAFMFTAGFVYRKDGDYFLRIYTISETYDYKLSLDQIMDLGVYEWQ